MWMAFKDTRLWKAWEWVKNFFTGWNKEEEVKQATPTTTTTSTQVNTTPTNTTNPTKVTQPTWLDKQWTVLWNPTNTSSLNETIEKQKEKSKFTGTDEITNEPTVQSKYYDINQVDKEKISKVLDKRENEENQSRWETAAWRGKNLMKQAWDILRWQAMDTDKQANEVKTYVGYNKDNNDVYEMVLDTEWTYSAQDKFNRAYSNYIDKVNQYWDSITEEQWSNEFDNLYNQVSWLFTAKADDWYSDWLFVKTDWSKSIWRRKDLFTDEQLDALAQNWITWKEKFIPSKEQLFNYLKAQEENINLNQRLADKWDIKEDPLQLDNSMTWRAQEVFMNRAMTWVIDLAKQNLKPQVAQSYLLNSESIITDTFDRAWSAISSLVEDAELTKLLAQRQWRELTEDEKIWVALADRKDDMLNALADSLNTYIKEHWDEAFLDDDWHIINVKDIFSDWRDLWWVISHPVIAASWLDSDSRTSLWMSNNMSWIDAFQKLWNEWRYYLNKNKWSWLRKWWAQLDYWMTDVWYALSEAWQQSVGSLMQVWNLTKDIVTWNIDNLQNRWNWVRGSLSQTAEMMNQDFTIGKAITTKETWLNSFLFWQDWSRTIKKYLLKAAEYWPEMAWNIIPDILLYSTWIWETWLFKNLSDIPRRSWAIQKATKAIQWINLLKKWRWIAEWTKMAAKALDEAADAPNWIKVWMQWLDKGITNWILDQTIDAQYSWYDTEAYSTPSMALSIWGTMLFETIPWLWKSWVLKMWKNIPWAISEKSLNRLLDWTAWDPIAFFSKPENAEAIKRIANTQYWKSPNGMTFDDFRKLSESFEEMKSVTKDYLNKLSASNPEIAKQLNNWNKRNMYRVLTQVYNLDSNSQIWKNIRALITKDWTNVADLAKYLWNISWDVEVWPYKSTIKLKNKDWEITNKIGTYWLWEKYDELLDAVLDWWLADKLKNWFTSKDINNIKSLSWYSDVNENMFTKWDDWKYYINEEYLEKLWVKAKDMPTSWAAREINKAEESEISNKFREVMKDLRESNKQISPDTIDLVANSQLYQDVREKVADVVC